MMLLLISNQCPVRHRRVHSRTAAQVFFSSWSLVLAVTVPRVSGLVDISQFTSHAKFAVLCVTIPSLATYN